jgi:hypothetical protein
MLLIFLNKYYFRAAKGMKGDDGCCREGACIETGRMITTSDKQVIQRRFMVPDLRRMGMCEKHTRAGVG